MLASNRSFNRSKHESAGGSIGKINACWREESRCVTVVTWLQSRRFDEQSSAPETRAEYRVQITAHVVVLLAYSTQSNPTRLVTFVPSFPEA